MTGCLVIRDRFGDVHAVRIWRAEPEDIEREARALAGNVACDDGETIKVGLCCLSDPGAARLADGREYSEGGIEWLYELQLARVEK